ncbi:MAG: hypothetical protein KatS3mg042_1776 [Rhodothermaceae bacterium]|nr:MAG: hypothetical protein KatS3mg042_0962 [Rhodothermaceae bacterium]GIV58863.1 MAG: hypothetical protein KatS3mg042_1776 [Rhodothermaceae bacterium]
MIIAGLYSFNNGERVVRNQYAPLLDEIEKAIRSVDAAVHKVKKSKEKTMSGRLLYSPSALNKAFKREFSSMGWINHRVSCDYPTEYYVEGYKPDPLNSGAFRDMDFVKDQLGIEIQFGKYAFMVYNVCAKMTIFHKLGVIDAGVEIVPVKAFAGEMSSGVSYFEQFVWDLEHRGVSDIDIPVLIIGIDADPDRLTKVGKAAQKDVL